MAGKPEGTPADAEIRALIADWARAIGAKDVNAAVRHYAADVVAFDLAPPLQYAGADALRPAWQPGSPPFAARSATTSRVSK